LIHYGIAFGQAFQEAFQEAFPKGFLEPLGEASKEVARFSLWGGFA
jgi:hypothetical protein